MANLITDPRANHAVPTPRSSLVGRDQHVAAIAALLATADVRLVTLTGPGGVGKTRLATAVAAASSASYRDGVCFVALDAVRDPKGVAVAIAKHLEMPEPRRGGINRRLIDGLRPRQMLLVLDNFEQVAAAAPLVADLLSGCPELRVLITSRIPLHVAGEREVPVAPLPLPNVRAEPDWPTLAANPAVQLFVERAREVKPAFTLTAANASAVAEICCWVDGLPLAIELAAARVKVLAPPALRQQLRQRLPLLTGGSPEYPARLRTMRDAIAWSYDLLPKHQQQCFRRLAVFSGGFSLGGAEYVVTAARRNGRAAAMLRDQTAAAGDESGSPLSVGAATVTVDVVDLVTALVDSSLLQPIEQPDGDIRFTMLETVREFALGRLSASGEQVAVREAHVDWCPRLAEAAEPALNGPHRQIWLRTLEPEQDNQRAALDWCLSLSARPEHGVRLAGALWWFWFHRGLWREGRDWIERAVDRAGDRARPLDLAKARLGAGVFAWSRGDYDDARAHLDLAVTTARAAGGPRTLALALGFRNELAQAQGDLDLAALAAQESLEILSRGDDQWGHAFALINLGNLFRSRDDDEQAAEHYRAAVAILRGVGDGWLLALPLRNLARDARRRGDATAAVALYRESLALPRGNAERWYISRGLEELAIVLADRGSWRRAGRLLGAAAALRQAVGAALMPPYQADHDQAAAQVRQALGPSSFEEVWAIGRAMSLDEVFADALALDPVRIRRGRGTSAEALLTSREVDVLRLLALGHSDRDSGAELGISPRTVERHITNIVNKLGMPSRTAVVAFAARNGLV